MMVKEKEMSWYKTFLDSREMCFFFISMLWKKLTRAHSSAFFMGQDYLTKVYKSITHFIERLINSTNRIEIEYSKAIRICNII